MSVCMILKSYGRRYQRQNSISPLKELITRVVGKIQYIPQKENEATYKTMFISKVLLICN